MRRDSKAFGCWSKQVVAPFVTEGGLLIAAKVLVDGALTFELIKPRLHELDVMLELVHLNAIMLIGCTILREHLLVFNHQLQLAQAVLLGIKAMLLNR